MAEDLLGVALVAAAGGTGTTGRPRLDKGIDLYLSRLRTMLTIPFQVKSSLLVGPDGAVTHYVPQADLRALSGGYLAFVHIPAPHDQLYERLFLIPDDEFRQRSALVKNHGVPCYRFTAQFAGDVDRTWAPFAVEIDQLSSWVAALQGWNDPIPPSPVEAAVRSLTKAENHNIAEIGALWGSLNWNAFA